MVNFQVLFFLILTSYTHACPTKCTCKDDGKWVDCSKQNFDHVPDGIPVTVETLLLNNNNIQKLANNTFSNFTKLKILNLRACQIDSIEANAFENTTLINLYLHVNQLSALPILSLNLLTDLYLDTNKFSSVPQLEGMKSLQHLSLSRNAIFKPIFPNLIKTLVSLDLSKNDIDTISIDSFKNVSSNLNVLHLNNNPKIKESIKNVSLSFASTTKLLQIGLKSIGLTTIKADYFVGLEHTKLNNMVLDENPITSISPDAFQSVSFLQFLFMKKCALSALLPNQFSKLEKLLGLTLSKNNISSIASSAFKDLGMLRDLDLSGNKITILDNKNTFDGLVSLKSLNLAHQNPGLISFNGAAPLNMHSLIILKLSYNQIRWLNATSFSGLTKLTNLFLDNNPHFEGWEASALESVSHTLISLDFSYGNLSRIEQRSGYKSSLSGLSGLKYLNLSSSPFNCSCTAIGSFVNWLQQDSKTIKVINKERYACASPASAVGKLLLQINCSVPPSSHLGIVLIIVIPLLVAASLMTLLVCLPRWRRRQGYLQDEETSPLLAASAPPESPGPSVLARIKQTISPSTSGASTSRQNPRNPNIAYDVALPEDASIQPLSINLYVLYSPSDPEWNIRHVYSQLIDAHVSQLGLSVYPPTDADYSTVSDSLSLPHLAASEHVLLLFSPHFVNTYLHSLDQALLEELAQRPIILLQPGMKKTFDGQAAFDEMVTKFCSKVGRGIRADQLEKFDWSKALKSSSVMQDLVNRCIKTRIV